MIDTLSRAMAGRDENSSSTWALLSRTAIGSIEHECPFDINSSRGQRRRSRRARPFFLRAATDTELEVIGKGRGKIEVKKQRDLDFAPDRTFRLVDVRSEGTRTATR